jgi:hypothetical protein
MSQPPQPGSPAPPYSTPPKQSRTNLVLGIVAGLFVLGIAAAVLILRPWDDDTAEPTGADSPSEVVERYLAVLDSWEADAFATQENAVRSWESLLPFMCAELAEELEGYIEEDRQTDPADWSENPSPEYVYDLSRTVDGSPDIDGDTATVEATVEYNTVDWEGIDWDDPDLVVSEVEVIRVAEDLEIELVREDGVWLICDRDAWLDL